MQQGRYAPQHCIKSLTNRRLSFYRLFKLPFKNMPQDTIVLKGETHLLRLDSESKQEVKKICYEMLAENEEGKIGKYFMLKTKLIELLLIMLREL